MTTFLFRPQDPATYPFDAAEHAPHYLEAWLQAFRDPKPVERDWEDWAENAARLWALKSRDVDLVFPNRETGEWPKAPHTNALAAPVGLWSKQDLILERDWQLIGTTRRAVEFAENYARTITFRSHAGRCVVSTGYCQGEVEQAVRDVMRTTRSNRVFIKSAQKETGVAKVFEFDSSWHVWPQLCAEAPVLEWSTAKSEGDNGVFLVVQEAVEMLYEYRVFVIDGHPVAGAGCIERYTPLQNKNRWDAKVERHRNKSDVELQPYLVRRYRDFAEDYCSALENEIGFNLDFSLDLYVTESGRIGVVEVNPPMNLGLYACDVREYTMAIIHRARLVEAGLEDLAKMAR